MSTDTDVKIIVLDEPMKCPECRRPVTKLKVIVMICSAAVGAQRALQKHIVLREHKQ